MVQRVNKGNRQAILAHIERRFTEVASANAGKVGLPQLWDIQFELESEAGFRISDYQSQKLTWLVAQSPTYNRAAPKDGRKEEA